MDESTIVLTNSISKAFTGSLLAMNLQRGTMKLDDPIQRYLPEITVPRWGDFDITLQHIATHRSGLQRDMPGQLLDLTGDAHLKFLEAYTLTRIPGVLYEYSNYAFSLLGIILSRSMGASYEELVEREITGPLGMLDTREELSSEQRTRLADNYTPYGDPSPHRPVSVTTPSGGLYSTTPDLMKFVCAHTDLASTPIGTSVEQALQRHAVINAGRGSALGWEVDFGGTPNEAFWKSGGSLGATSQVWFSRGLNYGVAILTNRGMPAQNGLPVPNSSPADAISLELRRLLTAAARA
jgi:CubicO group peptidase (beta-lactamase class C family)